MSLSYAEKAGEKIYSDVVDNSGFIKALRKGVMQMVCRTCGQVSSYAQNNLKYK